MTPGEIAAAVEAARSQKHRFVFVPGEAEAELESALTALAAETGRQLLKAPPPSAAELAARKLAASGRPTISRNDERGFLANLKKIARGELGVVSDGDR
jgi:hypothetical protein